MSELQKFLKEWFWIKFSETGSISAWINYKEVSSNEYSKYLKKILASDQKKDRDNNAGK